MVFDKAREVMANKNCMNLLFIVGSGGMAAAKFIDLIAYKGSLNVSTGGAVSGLCYIALSMLPDNKQS